jgi:metallo-beta-lactamase family protein
VDEQFADRGNSNMKLTFLGAAQTVTGSKYLLQTARRRILVDCGLFQGLKELRERNWLPLPSEVASLDAVILTHAHLDHSGYLPLLAKNGFKGPVYCTEATRDLCEILLPDSGHLQERDAEFANRHGYTKHKPAKPLYTAADAEASLNLLRPLPFSTVHKLDDDLTVRFQRAGHILGAASVRLEEGGTSLLFSGDLGRPNDPVMLDPAVALPADYLVVESTYGNRRHERIDPELSLAEIIRSTARRGGSVLIPAFAVGRTQSILYHLQRLKADRRIPDVPVYLDSPMAIDASGIFCRHLDDHKLSESQCRSLCSIVRYVRGVEESKALNGITMPKIVISASGMATGGRVLHHLKVMAPDRRNTILFTGFQAAGTRGAAMVSGASEVTIHGRRVPVRATVMNLDALSAHADADEIMEWLHKFDRPPRQTFVTHGEPAAAEALQRRVSSELGWRCAVPHYRETEVLLPGVALAPTSEA